MAFNFCMFCLILFLSSYPILHNNALRRIGAHSEHLILRRVLGNEKIKRMRACADLKSEDDERATKEVAGKLNEGFVEFTDLDMVDITSLEHSRNSIMPVKPPGETSRLLREWISDWYCYWDNSYGMPKNREQDFVFKPPLSERVDDIVFSKMANPFSSDLQGEADPVVLTLLRLRNEILGDDYSQCLFGSESDYPFLPILIKFEDAKKVELEARTVLQALGAHVQLLSSMQCYEMDQLLQDDDDENTDTARLSELYNSLLSLSSSSMKPLIFYCGSNLLNPVPLFIVSRLSPSLVGGFISAIIHT